MDTDAPRLMWMIRVVSMALLLLAVGTGCSNQRLTWDGIIAEKTVSPPGISMVIFHPAEARAFSILLPDETVLHSQAFLQPWTGKTFFKYSYGFVLIVLEDSRVKSVYVSCDKHLSPQNETDGNRKTAAIGDANGDKMYDMPVSERELRRLFGSPNEVMRLVTPQ